MFNAKRDLTYFMVLVLFSCNTAPNQIEHKPKKTPQLMPQNSVRHVHWGYDGEEAPEHWGNLTPAYALCQNGKSQSPIDIKANVTGVNNFKINYGQTKLAIAHNEHMHDLLDNGHTIQVSTEEGSNFELNNKTYHLKQFHFHTPSEHTINGQHAPIEIHFVHQAADSSLAVIGAMFYEGTHNKNFDELIPHLPNKKGEKITNDSVHITIPFNIPKNLSAFHYVGSLTTPPCTEDVQWLVINHKFTMSKGQIAAFTSRLHHNNRPTQPLNNRVLNKDVVKGEKL